MKKFFRTIFATIIYPRPFIGLFYLPKFIIHWIKFNRLNHGPRLSFSDVYPNLGDWVTTTPFDPHYFYQSSWLSRNLAKNMPAQHVDIGSDGDLLLNGALAQARENLMSPSVDMVFGDDLFIDEDARILQISNGYSSNLAQMMFCSLWSPLQDACFWKRSLYDQVGGINPEIRFAADYDLFLKMAVFGRTQYSPTVFSAFRRHTGQTSKLHERAYKQEKIESCKNLLSTMPMARSRSPLSLAFYWLYPRLRSRLMNNKKSSKHVVGQCAFNFSAEPTSTFGMKK